MRVTGICFVLFLFFRKPIVQHRFPSIHNPSQSNPWGYSWKELCFHGINVQNAWFERGNYTVNTIDNLVNDLEIRDIKLLSDLGCSNTSIVVRGKDICCSLLAKER